MLKFVTKLAVVAVVALALVAGSSSADAAFSRYLTVGSTGADVTELQTILVAQGYLVMPAGTSMGYFGTLTKNAVAKWQAAVGLPATGYFGPMSIAKIGAGASTGGSTGSTGGSTSGSGLSGGDGDFKDFDVLGNPDSTDIEEGATEEVLGFEFEADDSDLSLERVDVLFAENGSDTDKPWKVLEEVTLTVDGKEVASVDASDEDNWDEEENDEYSVKFEGFKHVVKEGKMVKAYVSVTAQDNLDTEDLGDWTVAIMDDGIRARNGDGIDVYEGSLDDDLTPVDTGTGAADERAFTLEEPTVGDITISVDDDENKDMDVAVDEDDDTNDVEVYIAQVESQEGDNTIEEVTVSLATTSVNFTAGLSDMIKTLYLFIDGEEVGSETVSDDDGAEDIVFEDIDVTIDEDEEVDFEVRADIDNQDGNYATSSVGFYVTGISVDFVDAQDDDQTQADTTDGGDINLRVDALAVELSSTPSAESPIASDESKGRFFVEFSVTAPKDSDIYISKGATTSTSAAAGEGAEFVVVDGSGTTVTATTTVSSNLLTKVSGGSETGGRYKVTKGQTAKFKLDVIVDNTNATSARTLGIQLTGVNYKVGSNAVADTQFTAGLDEDFRSDTAYLLTSNTSN